MNGTHTIVTAQGLQVWADGIFTASEAAEYIAANPFTESGAVQYAVTNECARRIVAQAKRVRVENEIHLKKALVEATRTEIARALPEWMR